MCVVVEDISTKYYLLYDMLEELIKSENKPSMTSTIVRYVISQKGVSDREVGYVVSSFIKSWVWDSVRLTSSKYIYPLVSNHNIENIEITSSQANIRSSSEIDKYQRQPSKQILERKDKITTVKAEEKRRRLFTKMKTIRAIPNQLQTSNSSFIQK